MWVKVYLIRPSAECWGRGGGITNSSLEGAVSIHCNTESSGNPENQEGLPGRSGWSRRVECMRLNSSSSQLGESSLRTPKHLLDWRLSESTP